MSNQTIASPANQLNLPFDSLSTGKEQGKLYQTCLYCKKCFAIKKTDVNRGRGKYCSKNCYFKARKAGIYKARIKKICPKCHKIFYVDGQRKNQICCSYECSYEYKKRHRVLIICKECGKKYEVTESRKNRTSVCSYSCLHKYMKRFIIYKKGSENPNWRGGKTQIEFKCTECGKMFKNSRRKDDNGKWQDRKFCSVECKNKFHSKWMKSKENPNYKNAKGKFICLECGEEFYYWKSQKRTFCSWKCMCKSSLQKEFMKKQFKDPAFLKKWQEGTHTRPSKLEKCFDDITPQLIRYVGDGSWWRMLPNGKSKNPDFKVTGQKKVIELYGDYWHRNDEPQELIDSYNQIGLQCLVIWENEVYNKKEEVIERVNKFISA